MPVNRRRFLALTGASALGLTRPAFGGEIQVLGGPAFGTYWRINLSMPTEHAIVRRRIEAIIASVDACLSPFRVNSEASRFNRLRTNDWMPVSSQTQIVVRAALRLARHTNGAFDPTVGPIVGRYGFGPIRGTSRADYRKLSVGPGAVRKDDTGLTLDLCGIAKGHALDRMVAALDTLGLDDYLIELGGEVFARGRHPSGRYWQVALERPVPGPAALAYLIGFEGKAVATSGDTINGYSIAGRRYSHIIDPRLGAPVNGVIASVSVLADNAMFADGLATALMAMGLEDGVAFARDRAVDALFLARDGERLATTTTGRFAERILT